MTPEQIAGWRLNIKADIAVNYHLHMGIALLREGSLTKAVEAFRRVLTISPDLAEAHAGLIRALRVSGDETGANQAEAQARLIAPDTHAIGLLRLGLLVLEAGRPTDARELGQQACGEGALFAGWLSLIADASDRQIPIVFPPFPALPPALERQRIEALLQKSAQQAMRAGHGLEAAHLLRGALACQEREETLVELAQLEQGRLALAEARSLLRRALELTPGSKVPAFSLVRTEIVDGRYAEARALLDGLTAASMHPLVALHQGVILLCTGDEAGALTLYERFPDTPTLRMLRIHALILKGEQAQAGTLLRQIMTEDLTSRWCHVDIATALMALGHHEEAIAYWQRIGRGGQNGLGTFLLLLRRWIGPAALARFDVTDPLATTSHPSSTSPQVHRQHH